MNIKCDNELTEFELQAELYTLLKGLGFNVRGEVMAYSYKWRELLDLTNVKRQSPIRAKLDIVILDKHNTATHIIEVKSAPAIHNNKNKCISQCKEYEVMFELPVILCWKRSQFTDIINTLSK